MLDGRRQSRTSNPGLWSSGEHFSHRTFCCLGIFSFSSSLPLCLLQPQTYLWNNFLKKFMTDLLIKIYISQCPQQIILFLSGLLQITSSWLLYSIKWKLSPKRLIIHGCYNIKSGNYGISKFSWGNMKNNSFNNCLIMKCCKEVFWDHFLLWDMAFLLVSYLLFCYEFRRVKFGPESWNCNLVSSGTSLGEKNSSFNTFWMQGKNCIRLQLSKWQTFSLALFFQQWLVFTILDGLGARCGCLST